MVLYHDYKTYSEDCTFTPEVLQIFLWARKWDSNCFQFLRPYHGKSQWLPSCTAEVCLDIPFTGAAVTVVQLVSFRRQWHSPLPVVHNHQRFCSINH